jgi:hypothetical protein
MVPQRFLGHGHRGHREHRPNDPEARGPPMPLWSPCSMALEDAQSHLPGHCSPAAVNVAPGPPARTRPAKMHATGRRSQRTSNRLDSSDSCCCRKEHRKKVRLIRPRQSEAEEGDQRNYGELPYFGVQSVSSPLPSPHDSFEQDRSWWRKHACLDGTALTDLSCQNNDLAASPQTSRDRTC